MEYVWSLSTLVVGVSSLTPVHTELDAGGPRNVVGFFAGNVTLHCNRDTPGAVDWSYIAPGKDHEQQISGR